MSKKAGILNILELIKILQKNSLMPQEIQERFQIKAQTFYKYIKYIKDAKFDVIKHDNAYSINKYAHVVNLDQDDIELILKASVLCENLLSSEEADKIHKTINKMLLMTNSKTYKAVSGAFLARKKAGNYNIYKDKINLFEEFLKKDMLIKIILKSKKIFLAKPYKITYLKDKMYFNFITVDNKIKTIMAERIVDMCPEYLIKTGKVHKKETIFELYGHLAQTYVLRDEEIIIDNFNKGIRVSNSSKDKNLLFRRLLRYDTLCKIIHPESDKIKFRDMVCNSIKNISGK